jgi:DnaJ-class molecular chaperone
MTTKKKRVVGGVPRSVREALKTLRNPSGDGKTKLSAGFSGEPLKPITPCSRCGGDGIDPANPNAMCPFCFGRGVE